MTNSSGRDIGELLQLADTPPDATLDSLRRIERHGARSFSREDRPTRSSQRQREIATVIIDRSALFRAGLAHILAETRFRVIASYASVFDVPAKTLHRRPCLLLVGLDIEFRQVLPKLASLRAPFKDLHVKMLTSYSDIEEFLAAVDAGGDGYLLKDEITPDALLTSLELIFLGGMVIPRGFTELFRRAPGQLAEVYPARDPDIEAEHRQPPPADERAAGHAGLSNREQTILEHLTRGASNKHIARELSIAEATVKVHVKSLLRKIHVRNRTQAAMWAMNHSERTAD